MSMYGAMRQSSVPPKSSISRKSAGRPRNEPSSSIRQYLTRKNIWKKKSSEIEPKKKKLVKSRHTCILMKTRRMLK